MYILCNCSLLENKKSNKGDGGKYTITPTVAADKKSCATLIISKEAIL
jgi:hypothetical protein